MNVPLMLQALLRLDDYLDSDKDCYDNPVETNNLLRLLEYGVVIDLQDDENLSLVILRGVREMPKRIAKKVVTIRNSEPFCTMDLRQELQVYKLYRKILKI